MFHRRSKKDYKWHRGIESNNNEWENLTYQQAEILLNRIENEFNKVGLNYSCVFRAPGWHIGKDAVRLLIDRGYIIAGNEKYYNALKSKIPNLHKKWKSYNWDLEKECSIDGDVIAFGHTSNWCSNFFNEEKYKLVVKLLESRKFSFKFIEEM